MKIKYKIKEVIPKVFCVTFKDQLDMSLLFLKYQEFYESPKFQNKRFTLPQYIRWYCKKNKTLSFSYPDDFIGYNVPGSVVEAILFDDKWSPFEVDKTQWDFNEYDDEMDKIWHKCFELNNRDRNFYIIGVMKGNKNSALKHEISHGMWFTNPQYKKDMTKLLYESLSLKKIDKFNRVLKKLGYAKSVHLDEACAYLSTGLNSDLDSLNISKKIQNKFKKVYKDYVNSYKRQ